jgi:CBS domain containing-hemolysin-like protein
MDDDSWLLIPVALILSAFFSGIEIAFVSANKLKIELEAKQGSWPAIILSRFIARPRLFIASMLVGNNLALVAFGIMAGSLISRAVFSTNDWHHAGNPYAALVVQTLLSTLVILVTAEFLPKALFRINPNGWLKALVIPLTLIHFALLIPAWLVTALSTGFLRLVFRAKMAREPQSFGTVDLDHYLKDITARMEPDQELEHEIQILQNALDFSQLKARDCLIPRNEIIAMSIEDDVHTLRQRFIETGLSKMVIYRDNIDNIIGYVHIRDVFKKPDNIKKILMPAFFIPEPMPATDVLENFIKKKRNLAIVVDEFGGTAGIITIEDVVEEIFGEIEDEHDKEELIEEQLAESHFRFSARLEIDYINEQYKLELPENDDYDTLGGLILHHTAEIPSEQEVIDIPGYSLRIERVSNTRIELVEILREH